jgi:3-hydroxypropanoate dehydrogenase
MVITAFHEPIRPSAAILRSMHDIPMDRPPSERLPTRAITHLFHRARTYSRWQSRHLGADQIRELYDTAAFGPTSANGNPARFVWIRSAAAKQRLAACVKPGNEVKVLGASATVIIGYDPEFYLKLHQLMPHAAEKLIEDFSSTPENTWETAFRNSALQGAYLIMAARALGLDCGPLSGFDHDKINAAFFADTKIRANFLCCIGWGSEEALFPRNPRLSFEEANQIL